VVVIIELSARQKQIIAIVKEQEPVTGEQIAEQLALSRAALRSDLAILTMAHVLEAKPRVGYFYSGQQYDYLIRSRIREIPVDAVKSMPFVIRDDLSVYDAIVCLFLEDVGTLFVVGEDTALEGVVSRKDLLKAALGGGDLHQMPVKVIMTRMPNVIAVTPEDTVYEAARRIVQHEVDALPVVRPLEQETGSSTGKSKWQVVGRITKTTLARLFVDMAEGRREEQIYG
jgi:CBS domain-containing protein